MAGQVRVVLFINAVSRYRSVCRFVAWFQASVVRPNAVAFVPFNSCCRGAFGRKPEWVAPLQAAGDRARQQRGKGGGRAISQANLPESLPTRPPTRRGGGREAECLAPLTCLALVAV